MNDANVPMYRNDMIQVWLYAVAAHSSSTHSCAEWPWWANHPLGTTMASRSVGMNNSTALTVVHARPPNFGTANVYGIRRIEPMRFGTSVKRNSSDTDIAMPT